MNLLSLLLNGLAGAATGYITNDIAVRMIFRKIGPFGGVLEETREEFIINVSELVEDEIINYNTIAGELERLEFRQEISRLLEEVVFLRLKKDLEEIDWQDIPGYQESCRGLAEILTSPKFIAEILTALAETSSLDEALSSEQLEEILGSSLKALDSLLDDPQAGGELSLILFNMLNIIRQEDSQQQALRDFIQDFQKELEKREGELNEALIDFYQQLQLEKFVENKLEEIFNTPLAEIYQAGEVVNSQTGPGQLMLDFLETDAGREIGQDLLAALFSSLQEINLTLPELFEESWNETLAPLLEEKLPEIIEELLLWLDDHSSELEDRVDRIIGEVLAEGQGLRNNIKQVLYRSLQGNIARRYGIIGSVMSGMAGDEKITSLARDLTEQLTEIFEKNSLGWLVYRLAELGLLEEELWYDFLLQRLRNFADSSFSREGVAGELPAVLSEITPADILGDRLPELLAEETPVVLASLTGGLLSSPETADLLQNKVNELFFAADRDNPVFQALEKGARTIFQDQERIARLAEELESVLSEYLSDRPLGLSNFQANLSLAREISDFLEEEIVCWLEEQGRTSPSRLLTRLEMIADYQDRMTDFFLEIIEENLAGLLQDRVSQAVADNLLQLSVEDMRRVVESFMGTELKPLTYFGGLLGFIAGLLLEITGGGMLAAADAPLRIIISMLVYGFVGFLTNVLAIKMIFRPYRPIRLAGLQLPLTPGLFARNQKRFAGALGDFVQDDLLEPYRISRLFQNQRPDIEEMISREMSSNYFRRVRAILRVSSGLVSEKIVDWGGARAYQQSGRLASKLAAGAENLSISEEVLDKLENRLKKLLSGPSEESSPLITGLDKLNEILLLEEQSLKYFLTRQEQRELLEYLKQGLGNFLAEDPDSAKAINNQEDEERQTGLEGLAAEVFPHWQKSLTGRKIKEIIPASSRNRITAATVEELTAALKQGYLVQIINEFFRREVAGRERGLNWLAGIVNLIEENFVSFLDFLLNRLEQLFKDNRKEIKSAAADILQEELGSGDSRRSWFSSALFRSAYYLTDGEATLYEIIDLLLDEELPEFLEASRGDIAKIFQPAVIDISRDTVWGLLQRAEAEDWQQLVRAVLSREEVSSNFQRFSRRLLESIWDFKLPGELFQPGWKILSGSGKEDRTFSAELKQNLKLRLFQQQPGENQRLKPLVDPLLQQFLQAGMVTASPASIWQALTGLNKNSAGSGQPAFLDPDQQKQLKEELLTAVELAFDFFRARPEIIKPASFLDLERFSLDLEHFIAHLSQNQQFLTELQQIFSSHITRSSGLPSRKIKAETAEHILNLLLVNSLDGLENHFQGLLQSLEIKEVAVTQVEEMDPAAIENLFNSFAGSYLTKLKFYGWSGSLVGLLTELIIGTRL